MPENPSLFCLIGESMGFSHIIATERQSRDGCDNVSKTAAGMRWIIDIVFSMQNKYSADSAERSIASPKSPPVDVGSSISPSTNNGRFTPRSVEARTKDRMAQEEQERGN